ncbi:MAG: hypothetical protein ACOX2O_01610 [Bdellovibrionota bacterium]
MCTGTFVGKRHYGTVFATTVNCNLLVVDAFSGSYLAKEANIFVREERCLFRDGVLLSG